MKKVLYFLLISCLVIVISSCVTCKQTTPEKKVKDRYLKEIEEDSFVPVKENYTNSSSKEFVYYDTPPRKINEAILRYPEFARKSRIQGTVTLEIEILTDGSIGTIEVKQSVLSGPGGLDEAAIEYARELKFEPAKANGKPVAVWITYPVNFYVD